jgi:pyruvate kinase
MLPSKGVVLNPGETVIFTSGRASIKNRRLPVTYDALHKDVKPGERILLDDGLLSAVVERVQGKDVVCQMIDGGTLTSHKGVNFPDSKLSVPSMNRKDREDAAFGVAHDVDWIALSFVRSAKEIYDLRYLIKAEERKAKRRQRYPIKIISKIEKGEAIERIDEIMEATDAIMVARGDLGIEMPAEEVPLIQKRLIDDALAAAKPVIVATQMLDSMIRNPRPTRAEVSDVANAVIDHTDAVMLSGETATGRYPVKSVRTMAKIIRETEASKYDFMPIQQDIRSLDTEEAISGVANILAREVKAKVILVASMSGDTGRVVSRYRTDLPTYVSTSDERVKRQMNISWGVVPFLLPRCETVEELVERSVGHLKKGRIVKRGSKMIIVAGEPVGVSGGVNLVEIRDVT